MNKAALTRFIIVALYISAFMGVMLGLVGGFQTGIACTALVFFSILSYKYPRIGLWGLLIYLPFSGSIIYSLGDVYQSMGESISYSGNHPLFHLIKDAFYLPALIALIQSRDSFWKLLPRSILKPLLIAIAVVLGVALITFLLINVPQQFDPQVKGSPFLMGILGLKGLVGYIPLLFCGYYLIRDRTDLFFLTRLHVILILICCSLAFLQYLWLVTGLCPSSNSLTGEAVYRASLQVRCLVGGSLLYNTKVGLIRLPGTFVAPWQWGWFLISSAFFTYGASVSDPSRRWRFLGWVAMVAVLAAAVISGQRIALAIVPATFVLLVLLTDRHKGWLPLKLGIGVLLAIWITRTLGKVEERVISFVDRWEASPPHTFMLDQFQWVLSRQEGVLGHGLGRATNAARRLGETQLIETYYAKLFYEIGPIGVLAFLALVSLLTFLTFKAYRSVQDSSLQRLGLCLWVFVLFISYNTYYYPLAVDPVEVYYWFFAGVLLKLPRLDDPVASEKLCSDHNGL